MKIDEKEIGAMFSDDYEESENPTKDLLTCIAALAIILGIGAIIGAICTIILLSGVC